VASSQWSGRSIPSQSPGIPSRGLLTGINPQRPHCGYSEVSSPHQATETGNRHSPFPIESLPAKEVCIACNVPCKDQKVLARHQKEQCEQKEEWQCRNCSPMKTFRRQDRFIEHYQKDHGLACVENYKKQQKGLCQEHLNNARADLPAKKAWGCPCCANCFDSREAWKIHSTGHRVENEKVVGWSQSTMVQSLLFHQPYLATAVASLRMQGCDWDAIDWTKVSDSTLKDLRHALERHKLPDAVQARWDYRMMEPPDALVHYAFVLGAYGQAYLHDVRTIGNDASPVDETAEQTQAGIQGQHFTPLLDYCDQEDSLAYGEGSPATESADVDPYFDQDSLRHRSAATIETHATTAIHLASPHGRFMQHHDQILNASPPAPAPEAAQSSVVLGSSGLIAKEAAGHDGERVRRPLSKKKSVKNFFKGLSPTKPNALHSEVSLPTSALPAGEILVSNWIAAVPSHNRDFTVFEATETHQPSQQQAVVSNRMSHLPDAWAHAPEEQHYQ
jgi:hypothetical protein